MNWMREHKKLTTMLVVLLLLCIIITLSFKFAGNSSRLGRIGVKIAATVQEPLSSIQYGIKNGLGGIFNFKKIMEENELLEKENLKLRRQNIKLTLQEKDLAELRELANVLGYESISEDRELVSADVISMDGSNWFNIFTINKGSNDGVYENAIIVNGEGLVGRVMEVGDSWSKISALIDESSKVSFKIMGNLSLIGVVSGDGKGDLSGYMIDNEAGVIEGNKIISSGMGIYPEGIEIGKIVEVKYDSDTQLKNVKVEPSVYFESLQKVTVVL